MKRRVIQIDADLFNRVRARASERGISVSQVFREALERDLPAAQGASVLQSIGAGSSGRRELAARAGQGEFVPRTTHSWWAELEAESTRTPLVDVAVA